MQYAPPSFMMRKSFNFPAALALKPYALISAQKKKEFVYAYINFSKMKQLRVYGKIAGKILLENDG